MRHLCVFNYFDFFFTYSELLRIAGFVTKYQTQEAILWQDQMNQIHVLLFVLFCHLVFESHLLPVPRLCAEESVLPSAPTLGLQGNCKLMESTHSTRRSKNSAVLWV